MSQSKVYSSAEEALKGVVSDGQTLAIGGFGLGAHCAASAARLVRRRGRPEQRRPGDRRGCAHIAQRRARLCRA